MDGWLDRWMDSEWQDNEEEIHFFHYPLNYLSMYLFYESLDLCFFSRLNRA